MDEGLTRKLCWILRHGALETGLPVADGAWVPEEAVLAQCRSLDAGALAEVVGASRSKRAPHRPRFELRDVDGSGARQVRATYAHTGDMLAAAMRDGGGGGAAGTARAMPRPLWSQCVMAVCRQFRHYPTEALQQLDGHARTQLLRALRASGRLSNGSVRALLAPGVELGLEELDLSHMLPTASLLRRLRSCPRLRTLKLARADALTDTLACQIFGPAKCKSGGKGGCGGAPHGPLAALLELDLQGCRHIGRRAMEAVAGGCPELEALNIGGCAQLGDNDVCALAPLRALRRLTVRGCPNITNSGLRALPELFCRWQADPRAQAWLGGRERGRGSDGDGGGSGDCEAVR
eukprot:g6058.t1